MQDQQQLTDLNVFRDKDLDFSNAGIRSMLKNPTFVSAEGWAEFQDYDHLSAFAMSFPALLEFIGKSSAESVKSSEIYTQTEGLIQTLRGQLNSTKVQATKQQLGKQITEAEQFLRTLTKSSIESPPAWLLEGMKLFIRTLMPNRLELRVYPFEQNPQFCVIANLKRDCFVDSDLANVMFAYGRRPDLPLTVFGLTTALPQATGHPFPPIKIPARPGDEGDLEAAFRRIFGAFEGMEAFVRYATYPRVVVYPIAIYQRLGELLPEGEGSEILSLLDSTTPNP